MQAPTRNDPPYIPIRSSGWGVRRTPRWVMAAGVVLLAVGVAVGLSHRPSSSQRAADLNGVLSGVTSDIGSCAAGVREALGLLTVNYAGAASKLQTAISEANYGSSNCSPANNELLGDLTAFQLPESLSSYHLQPAITGLIDWAAPDAERVQADVAKALTDRGKPAAAADLAALRRDLATLDAERTHVYSVLKPAIRALSPHAALPVLPG